MRGSGGAAADPLAAGRWAFLRRMGAVAVAVGALGGRPPAAAAQGPNVRGYATIPDPLLLLLREPAVHQELRLTDAQRSQLLTWNAQCDPTLLAARGWDQERSAAEVQKILVASRQRLEASLTADQRTRLDQLASRVRGISCVLAPTAVQRLQLSDAQREACAAAVAEADAGLAELRERMNGGELDSREAESASRALQEKQQRTILETLTEDQRRRFAELIGPVFDLGRLGRVSFKAPSVAAEGPWINSAPLDAEALRGKVVAVHFWAFGCANCIENYPWLRQWQRQFADRDFVLIGIHAPETEAERSIESLRAAVRNEQLEFPIVVDNERRLWETWGNTIWPAVYLIDKHGSIRYWWYGELNWRNAGGQTLMAAKIAELLEEPVAAENAAQSAAPQAASLE